ncbi:glycosyl hydrolase family 28 protein, partial [Mycobacterium kansasii]
SFVTDTTIRSISSVNSKFFHMNMFRCKNIKIQSINISAPEDSPNTDGIHIGDSSGVKISRSIIGTGDDCISIGPGNSNISI